MDVSFVFAGAAAAGTAWMLNGLLYGRPGGRWLVITGPGTEEILKTGAALLTGADIFFSHVMFGFIEGIRDTRGKHKGSLLAGFFSLAGHSLFGYAALLGYARYQAFIPAVVLSFIPHMLWNGGVLILRRYLTPRH